MNDHHPFLTAEWRYLLVLNYEIEPAVLAPLLPAGTELDLWDGKALASVVGFQFLHTRVLSMPVPFHTRFEEINLRFYVHRQVDGETRRGVVFVKEIVPLAWITRIARVVYGENYVTMPIRRTIEEKDGKLCPEGLVEYAWRYKGRLNRLGGLAQGDLQPIEAGSEAEFILEQHWGFTCLGRQRTGEYRVEHPAWRTWSVAQPYLLCDVKAMYGAAFEPFLRRRPRSAFLAEGSKVAVFEPRKFTSRGTHD